MSLEVGRLGVLCGLYDAMHGLGGGSVMWETIEEAEGHIPDEGDDLAWLAEEGFLD